MNRADVAFVALSLALASGAAAGVDRGELARAGVGQMAAADLRVLGLRSGLTDAHGRSHGDPLPVFVQQEGGPLWVTEAVTDAARRTDWLRLDARSHHRLHAEVVHTSAAWALRLSLWRHGWSLRSPVSQRMHLAPWVATASAVAGAIAALARKRFGVGLAVAGALAQLLVLALPRLPVGEVGVRASIVEGPLAQIVIALAGGMEDAAVTIGIAVVVACLVLIALDHRRSRGRGGVRLGLGLLGVVGGVAWLEAGARSGLLAYATTTIGALGLAGLLGLWGWVSARTMLGLGQARR